jgi:hypothetical protein
MFSKGIRVAIQGIFDCLLASLLKLFAVATLSALAGVRAIAITGKAFAVEFETLGFLAIATTISTTVVVIIIIIVISTA